MKKEQNWWEKKRNNNDILKDNFFKGWKGFLKFWPIIILAAADAFAMAAPYYMWNVFPDLYETLNISQGQLLYLTSAIGLSTLICQLPGGWLADKISSKKMLASSLIMTGTLMILWSLMPFWGGSDNNGDGINDSVLYMMSFYLIYIGWGISTTLLFWTPLWKLLSQQASKEEQGTVFGLQGMFNGLIGFFFIYLLGFAALQITAEVLGVPIGFSLYSLFISFVLIGTGFAVMVWIREKPTSEKFSLDMKTMTKVMRNYKLWLMAFFVMGIYVMQQGLTKMMPFMSNSLFIAVWLVSLIGAFRTYLARMIASKPSGKFGDRHRSYIELLVYALGISIILLALAIVLPGFHNDFANKSEGYQQFVKIAIMLIMISLGFLCWFMVTLRYTEIIEIDTPKNSYANVVAFISFIAFSTDAWLNPILGHIANKYSVLNDEGVAEATQTGNQIILGSLLVVAIFGFICGLTLWMINHREYKKNGLTSYRKDLNNSIEESEKNNEEESIIKTSKKLDNNQKNNQKTIFLAHRGLSSLYPENTEVAFKAAQMHGYVGIETDLHLSEDGKLVICHDEDIIRTSDGHGLIKDLTLKQLKSYNFAQKFKKGIFDFDTKEIENLKYQFEAILTLEEFLEKFGDKFEYINLEIKTDIYHYPNIEEKVIKILNNYSNLKEKIIISSFDFETLKKIKALDADLKLGYLIWEEDKFRANSKIDYQLVKNTCDYINIWDQLYLDPENKKDLDKFKLPYIVWFWNQKNLYDQDLEKIEKLITKKNDVMMLIGNFSFAIYKDKKYN